MYALTLDFETYSEAGYVYSAELGYFVAPRGGKKGLELVGAAAYAEHPSTRVSSLSYEFPYGAGCALWLPGFEPPGDLFNYVSGGGIVEAHGSLFEFFIWYYVCHIKMGWPALRLPQLTCSMAKARAYSLPGALDKATAVMCPHISKDAAGHTVMRQVSAPRKPTEKLPDLFYTPQNAPDKFNKLYAYNIQDVVAEKGLSSRLPDLSEYEAGVRLLDQQINVRGVAIDRTALAACLKLVDAELAGVDAELDKITGGVVTKVTQLERIKGWLNGLGVVVGSLAEDALNDVLARADLPTDARRVLQLRQLGGSAGIKKLYKIEAVINLDGRIRGMYEYCGADRTGRWAGRGVQLQNLQNSGPDVYLCPDCKTWSLGLMGDTCVKCGGVRLSNSVEWGPDAMADAIADIIAHQDNSAKLRWAWGDIVPLVSACLRGLFCAGAGKEFISSDFSAIEAVVLAFASGCEWRIGVFRTHGMIYETSASRISKVPFEDFINHKKVTGEHHPLRKKLGKVSELASGYGGWIGAWYNFGAGDFMGEEEIKKSILAWRAASPEIPELWGGQLRKDPHRWAFTPELFGLEGAWVSAMLQPGHAYSVSSKYVEFVYQYDPDTDIMYCLLPSGRKLHYHKPRLNLIEKNGHQIYKLTYWGNNSDSERGPKGWFELETYGGKLAENNMQAVSRDIQANSLLAVDEAGYPVVMHTHDDITAEVDEGTGDIANFENVMSKMPAWAKDWPVKASGGWISKRYRK